MTVTGPCDVVDPYSWVYAISGHAHRQSRSGQPPIACERQIEIGVAALSIRERETACTLTTHPAPPSPPTVHRYATASPHNYKADLVDPVRIFSQDDDVPSAYPSPAAHWQQPAPRPSLLQELYEQDSNAMSSPEHNSPPDMYVQDDWPQAAPPQQQQQRAPHDYTLIRRATFPYARQERPEDVPMASYPPFLYNNDGTHSHHHAQMPLTAEPGALHSHHGEGAYSYDPQVKVEHEQHAQMQYHPPPPQFYRPPPPHHAHPSHHAHPHAPHPYAHAHHPTHPHLQHHGMGGGIMHPTYPTHGLPVQHTDDAASKETQYLRRRCFNCHTTEPPSWRRSTLNPGKIVCNKCGLYERTHLRARPLRFDELRAGNKARKGAGKGGVGSPKQPGVGVPGGVPVKRAGGIARRSSVSSTGSSAQSGSGASDWDDSGYLSLLERLRPRPRPSPRPTPAQGSPPPSRHPFLCPRTPPTTPPPAAATPRSPPLLNGSISAHHVGSPPGSANSYNGAYPAVGSPHIGSPHLNGAGIRLPHAPEIPTLVRTKPRSNTTGGLHSHSHTHSAHHIGAGPAQQQQMYYSPPLPSHHATHGALHHSSSNSSLHSSHSQQSPAMAPSSLLPDGGVGGQGQHELYRRGSLPDFHASFNAGAGMGGEWGADDGMGVSVKEEPRAVVV
ncbi:GATA-type domain-containing protein [Mycena sanguinolenta]|uniref:GATA-type domain-containing protein n=1 Tax=Mycena sanguinolenta TaxID=230812 RepID=A0A8H6X6C2_9AGAR|nr:GATA-type domain-containing protein [Mycena sanguinolenta]